MFQKFLFMCVKEYIPNTKIAKQINFSHCHRCLKWHVSITEDIGASMLYDNLSDTNAA